MMAVIPAAAVLKTETAIICVQIIRICKETENAMTKIVAAMMGTALIASVATIIKMAGTETIISRIIIKMIIADSGMRTGTTKRIKRFAMCSLPSRRK